MTKLANLIEVLKDKVKESGPDTWNPDPEKDVERKPKPPAAPQPKCPPGQVRVGGVCQPIRGLKRS